MQFGYRCPLVLAPPLVVSQISTRRFSITRFPEYPEQKRFRVEIGRPADRPDIIIRYYDDQEEAREDLQFITMHRPDACRGILHDLEGEYDPVIFLKSENCLMPNRRHDPEACRLCKSGELSVDKERT